jgi:hypothetical protein
LHHIHLPIPFGFLTPSLSGKMSQISSSLQNISILQLFSISLETLKYIDSKFMLS